MYQRRSGSMTKAVLSVKNLTVSFKQSGGRVAALRNVSFTLNRGEILGLVGESGSGKSLTALTIMKLLPQQAQIEQGEIRLEGEVISRLSEKEMRRYRGSEVSMIFQEPMTALNPLAS